MTSAHSKQKMIVILQSSQQTRINLKAERYIYTTDRIDYKPFVLKNEQGFFVR